MVYEGRGKGKTTAAIGMAVRALGTGMNVFITHFIKGEWPNGERDFFAAYGDVRKYHKGKKIGEVHVELTGKGFVKILGDKKPMRVHRAAARAGLMRARKALKSGRYQLVVMDEAISAVEEKLLTVRDLVETVKLKPPLVHLVMTGHVAPRSLVVLADLVSRVDMVKHPYYKGILAQKGIDF